MKVAYFLFILVGVTSGTLVEKPSNTAVRIGDKLRLNCSSDITPATNFSWSLGLTSLYGCLPDRGQIIPTPYYFESKENGCDLIVDEATYYESGGFKCETGVLGEQASASVAVLSVDSPSLTYSGNDKATVGSGVTVQCSMEYAGPMTGSLFWTMDPDFQVINISTSKAVWQPIVILAQVNVTMTVTHSVPDTYSLACSSLCRPLYPGDVDPKNVTYGFETIEVTFTKGGNGSPTGPSLSALLFGIIGFITLRSIRSRVV